MSQQVGNVTADGADVGAFQFDPSQIAQFLKGDSSKWIHDEFPKLHGFEWQDGYGGFTVSKSQIPDVIEYIKNQREHHRKKTFQDEYLGLLMKHGVDYDEGYLWG